MKTQTSIARLSAVLGIVAVLATAVVASQYVAMQRQIRWHEHLGVYLDRIYYNECICSVLKQLNAQDLDAATVALDMALCDDILKLERQTVECDAVTRQLVRQGFAQLHRLRPKLAGTNQVDSDRLVAQKVLAQAAISEEAQR